MTGLRPRKRPCPSCPYRAGVPPGIWDAEEYAKLPGYDGPTWAQAETGVFLCHQGSGELCAGWVGCHDMGECLAIRIHHDKVDLDAVYGYVSPVPLFASGAEAAAHGLDWDGHPPAEARAAAGKIIRVRAARGQPVTPARRRSSRRGR